MSKKKKIIWSILFLFLWLFVSMNLLFNTVYYAAHVPRAHYRVPEALAVVDHISLFTEEELKGYRTNSDGGNLIGKESGDLSE